MKKWKRGLITILAFMLAVIAAPAPADAADATGQPDTCGVNEMVLKRLLNDRSAVVLTLLGDKFSAYDPGAIVNDVAGADFMYTDILNNYRSDDEYRVLVDVWYRVTNLGETIVSVPAELVNVFLTDEAWTSFIQGADYKNLNAVLMGALKGEYVSSSGMSIDTDMSSLQLVRQLNETYSTLNDRLSNLEDLLGFITDVNDIYQNDYIYNFLPSYGEGLFGYLRSLGSVYEQAEYSSFQEESYRKLLGTSDMYALVNYNSYGFADETNKSWRFSTDLELFADRISGALSVMGTAVNAATGTLDGILVLESALAQNGALTDVLDRSQEMLTATDAYRRMTNTYIEHARRLDGTTLEEIAQYALINSVNTHIANQLNNATNNLTFNVLKNGMSRLMSVNTVYSSSACSAAVSQSVSEICTALALVKYSADACVGLTETAKKIYELCALNDIEDVLRELYLADVANYNSAVANDQSREDRDELASKVLDDLYMLKRVKLRGNEIAYKMTIHQADDTITGWIAGGGVSEGLEQVYRNQQNALIDSLIYNYPSAPYALGAGERLLITDYNGLEPVGYLTKADGTVCIVPEIDCRLYAGLTMSSGSTLLCSTDCYVGPISSSGTITVAEGAELFAAELYISGATTVNSSNGGFIHVGGDLISADNLTVTGTVVVDGDFRHQKYTSSTGEYTYTKGVFEMNDAAALLEIKGDYHAGGVTYDFASYHLTAGTIRLYGDFYDYSWIPSLLPYFNFLAKPDSGFTVELCGDGLQSIICDGNISVSFDRLAVTNGGGISITGNSGISVNDLQSDLNIRGDLSSDLSVKNWNGHSIYGENDMRMTSALTVSSGGTLHVGGNLTSYLLTISSGDVLHVGGDLICANGLTVTGIVEVDGDFRHQKYTSSTGDYTYTKGVFEMNDAAALLEIKGDYHAGGITYDSASYHLTAGTIRLYGDFYDYSSSTSWYPYYNFLPKPDSGFTVELCGDGLQSIICGGISGVSFDRLAVTNGVGISITGIIGVSINDLPSDLNIRGNLSGDLSVKNWNGHVLSVLGSTAMPKLVVPNGYVKKQKSYELEGMSYYDTRYMPEDATIFTDVSVKSEPETGTATPEIVEVTGAAYSLQEGMTICCALYSANGRLLSLELISIPSSQDEQEWIATLNDPGEGREIRVLMFDDSLVPVMEMLAVTLPAA